MMDWMQYVQHNNMTPIRNQILTKPFPSDNITEGGLFIPDSVRKPSNKMKVIKVGNGSKKKPMTLKEGQTVYRVDGWGTEVFIDGELHFLMEDNAILAVQ